MADVLPPCLKRGIRDAFMRLIDKICESSAPALAGLLDVRAVEHASSLGGAGHRADAFVGEQSPMPPDAPLQARWQDVGITMKFRRRRRVMFVDISRTDSHYAAPVSGFDSGPLGLEGPRGAMDNGLADVPDANVGALCGGACALPACKSSTAN